MVAIPKKETIACDCRYHQSPKKSKQVVKEPLSHLNLFFAANMTDPNSAWGPLNCNSHSSARVSNCWEGSLQALPQNGYGKVVRKTQAAALFSKATKTNGATRPSPTNESQPNHAF